MGAESKLRMSAPTALLSKEDLALSCQHASINLGPNVLLRILFLLQKVGWDVEMKS